jgi:hypothetical protein
MRLTGLKRGGAKAIFDRDGVRVDRVDNVDRGGSYIPGCAYIVAMSGVRECARGLREVCARFARGVREVCARCAQYRSEPYIHTAVNGVRDIYIRVRPHFSTHVPQHF